MTMISVNPVPEVTSTISGSTASVAGASSCVIFTVITGVPPCAVIVIIPWRLIASGFSAKVTVNVPLYSPVPGETINQGSLVVAVHCVFDVTVNVQVPASKPTSWLAGLTLSDGGAPAWWIVTSLSGVPSSATSVMVAMRGAASGFSS